MTTGSATAKRKVSKRSDADLVKRCVRGQEAAWAELIDKYKRLIFSIPVKYGFSRDDAAEVFQAVCAELVTELPRLRQAGALPAWLIKVTSHKCFQRARESKRFTGEEPEETAASAELPQQLLEEVEQEQAVRDALGAMAPRCRELIRMLFYETPCRPYAEIARELGLATGSIGFIRGRCLEKMRKRLSEAGIQ